MLCQGMFRLDITNNFFTESTIDHWNRMYREVVEPAPFVIVKGLVGVALRHLV